MRLKLVPETTNFDFFKFQKLTLGLSVLLILVSVVAFAVQGLNFGIDFRGGTMLTAATEKEPDVGLIRDALTELDVGDTSVTRIYDPAAELTGAVPNQVAIRIEAKTDDAEVQRDIVSTIEAALIEDFPGIRFLQVDSVGAKVSGELVEKGILAIVLAIAAVLFYIWLRFEWQFSVGAVAALVHDIILTIGVFSIVQLQFNLSIIAAILTIVGYSLNDTVVVFDRVRENLRRYKQTPLQEVLNLSINETLSRTVMTSLTTLLALIALYVLGGDVIRGFTFAMIWGVIVGTYSSVFVASPILNILGVERDPDKKEPKAGTNFADVDA
ncbi:protein translocase subunit SecF [Halovulum sp. GXIMD14794]